MNIAVPTPFSFSLAIAPLDGQRNPIESKRVGTTPAIPRIIELPITSGHLFVPRYQLLEGVKPNQPKERRIRCAHKGETVLDTTFRLASGS